MQPAFPEVYVDAILQLQFFLLVVPADGAKHAGRLPRPDRDLFLEKAIPGQVSPQRSPKRHKRSARHGAPENIPVGGGGEHGGDPKAIRLLVGAGGDYVSCSPFRVPVARLAVAQALLEN